MSWTLAGIVANRGALALACLTLIGSSLLITVAHAERLRAFEQENYKGEYVIYSERAPNLRGANPQRKIGSVRVLTGRWLLCAGANYLGDCAWIARDLPSLPNIQFTNDVGSLRPESVPVLRRHWGDKGPPSRHALVLFSQANYDGEWVAVRDSVPDFAVGQIGVNPASIILNGGVWRLCTEAKFGGRCLTLTGSTWDLQDIFTRGIKSAERIQ